MSAASHQLVAPNKQTLRHASRLFGATTVTELRASLKDVDAANVRSVLEVKDRAGQTALLHHTYWGRRALVEELLAWGADPTVRNAQGLDVRAIALTTKSKELIRMLQDALPAEAGRASQPEPRQSRSARASGRTAGSAPHASSSSTSARRPQYV